MKRPVLRVSKWLADIPVEACCSLCADAIFRPAASNHRPNKIEYQQKLQEAFDRHLNDAHPAESLAKKVI
jgi:hypothetical protein